MIRPCTTAMTFAATMAFGTQAFAAPIVPTDLDDWNALTGANQVLISSSSGVFTTASAPPPTIGTLDNEVFRDLVGLPAFPGQTLYTYTHRVDPTINNISEFNTGFSVAGFTGIAGWDFDDSAAAGAPGPANDDFRIEFEDDGTLDFMTNWSEGGSSGWDASDLGITFFFVSTKPPAINDYNLINSEVGTGQSFAPVPEPGTMVLLGSGLAGLYAAARRRRHRQT